MHYSLLRGDVCVWVVPCGLLDDAGGGQGGGGSAGIPVVGQWSKPWQWSKAGQRSKPDATPGVNRAMSGVSGVRRARGGVWSSGVKRGQCGASPGAGRAAVDSHALLRCAGARRGGAAAIFLRQALADGARSYGPTATGTAIEQRAIEQIDASR